MADVTQILLQIESGDPAAAAQLLPLVYDELRIWAIIRRPGSGSTKPKPTRRKHSRNLLLSRLGCLISLVQSTGISASLWNNFRARREKC